MYVRNKPGSLKHDVLLLLKEHVALTADELLAKIKLTRPRVTPRGLAIGPIRDLIAEGFLDGDKFKLSTTADGLAECRRLDAIENKVEIVRSNLHVPTGTYNGAELKRHCVRPGAYDAYELPSLINQPRK